MKESILAIDLGTSKLMAGIYLRDIFNLIQFDTSEYQLPAWIAIDKEEQILIGEAARKQAVANPQQTYYSILRYLGQNLSLQRIKDELQRLPYTINVSSKGEQYITSHDGKNYFFGHLLAKMLGVVKNKAQTQSKTRISKAIAAVPPMISHNRKDAIRNAFQHAKLDIIDWIESPLAAGIAYAHQLGKPRTLAVLDLGAGALKICVIQVKSTRSIEIITTFATEDVSGEDFDYRLFEWIKSVYKQKTNLADALDPSVRIGLKQESEKYKRELSRTDKILIDIPELFTDKKKRPYHLQEHLLQRDYERLVSDLISSVVQHLKQTIRSVHLLPKDVDEILLIGGQTLMPALVQQIGAFSKDWTITKGLDYLVAMGAALKAMPSVSFSLNISQRQVLRMGRLASGYLLARRFEIVSCIGEGSFSYIYEVKDRSDNQVYALKIMRPEFRNDQDIYDRFIKASTMALKVRHPNVVQFYEIIDNEELTSVRMELMKGWTLEEFLKSERFSKMRIETQLDLVAGIVEGMIGLRSSNLYHGDLKPDNIWVAKNGRPILFDFGLARYANGEPIVQSKVTGTPRYMSPEHLFKQSPFGDWSEIYSLGLILYRCFTMEFPRRASDPKQEYLIFDFSDSEPIEPCKVNVRLPRKLGDFIYTCIRRRRGDRYQSFEEVLQELQVLKNELRGTLITI